MWGVCVGKEQNSTKTTEKKKHPHRRADVSAQQNAPHLQGSRQQTILLIVGFCDTPLRSTHSSMLQHTKTHRHKTRLDRETPIGKRRCRRKGQWLLPMGYESRGSDRGSAQHAMLDLTVNRRWVDVSDSDLNAERFNKTWIVHMQQLVQRLRVRVMRWVGCRAGGLGVVPPGPGGTGGNESSFQIRISLIM